MNRTNFLGPLSALIVVGLVPIGVACNGHVVSVGNTGDTLQPVTTGAAAAEASGTTASGGSASVTCATGWAHPNVCCSAGPDSDSSCGYWENDPFRACESGYTTYPDQLQCCELANPANCTNSSSPASPPIATPPPAYGCGFACPPGWWAQPPGAITPGGPEGAMCCSAYEGGGTQCVSQGGGWAIPVTACATNGSGPDPISGGSSSGGNPSGSSSGSGPFGEDAGVPVPPTDASIGVPEDGGILFDDAGTTWIDDGGDCTEDASSPYPPGYDGGLTSLCPVCPAGWSSDPVQPELCCTTIPGGVTLCFSQATGSGTSIGGGVDGDDDGGVISTPGNPGTGVSGSSSGGGAGSSSSGGSSSGGAGSSSSGSGSWGAGGASEDGGPAPTCTGNASTCSCDETVNGAIYALDCYATSSGTVSCSCTVNGTTVTIAPPSVDSCEDSNAVISAFSACAPQ
jgi:hypothetical protein